MITSTTYIKRNQLILALLFLFSVYSYAQLKHPFEPRYNESINGDFAMIANNTVSRHATNPYILEGNNNNFTNLVYVDIDSFDDTFNSSNATFKAPIADSKCLTIRQVYLYWTASDFEPDPNDPFSENQEDWDFNDVKLMLPGQTNYTKLTADEVIYRGRDDNGDGTADDHFSFDPYVCFKDITDFVTTELLDKNISPYDTYQVANVESSLKRNDEHNDDPRFNVSNSGAGGWQIVFVYESPTLPLKNISIFDGYAHVFSASDDRDHEVEITGFTTVPAPQDVNVNILFGAIEGDRTFLGDRLQILPPSSATFMDLTTGPLTPIRAGNNFFNSRITHNNSNFIDRNPASTNTLGFDAGIFELNNENNSLIGNNQTSTTLNISTTQESYGLYLLGLSVEVFEPKLGPIEVTTDVSSAAQNPGATITGNFVVENKGNDDAIDVRIYTTLPPQLTVDFPITNLPTGVSATYDSSTGYLEFTVEDSSVTSKSIPLNVDFNLVIKDECYFLTENCDTQFGLQFTAKYRGVLNDVTQTTTSSSVVECGVGNNDRTIINVIKPTVDWQTPEDSLNRTIECNDVSALSDAQALLPDVDASCTFSITESRGSFVADNSCPDTGTITNTWSFTDECSNTTKEFTQIITIESSATIVIPDDGGATVNCLANATESFTIPEITDSCGNVLPPSAPVITDAPSPLDCDGTRTYTYTFTDCSANSYEWAYIYTITTPTFTIPDLDGALTVECIDDADGTTITLPTIQDVCGNELTASAPVITESPNPLTCEGNRTYTYTFTDCAGNSDEWAFVYSISTPTFTIPNDDGALTVECIDDADGTTITLPTIQDACGNTLTASAPVITDSANPFDCEGTRTYTYTFTDCAGNSDEWDFVYTIELNAFTLPANGIETVTNLNEAVEPTPPTVNDNCGNPITPSEAVKSETPDCQGSVVYTFTYTDCANNTADWTYTYTIELAPFTVPENETSTVDCIAQAIAPTPPTVNDANGDEITPVMTSSTAPECEGDLIYTFTYTDCAGNTGIWEHTYSIVTPAFTIPDLDGALTVECIDDADGTAITLPTIQDACGNELTASAPVITESPNPLTCQGNRTYTYTFTDCAGNSDEWAFVYTISTPTFTIPNDDGALTVECIDDADGTTITLPTIQDACGNTLTASAPVITDSANPFDCEGTRTYTFTFTDCAGNSDEWDFVYTIELNTFTLPANGIETVTNLNEAVEPTPPTVNDNCGNPITPSEAVKSETPDCQGSVIYTFTYTDCANNTANWTYTYTIELAPFTVPENETSTVECISQAIAPTPPTVNDANGDEIIPVMTSSTAPECEGDLIYTFTYTDCAGNTDIWEHTYSIDVTTLPTVPENQESTVVCLTDATQPATPAVNDACGNPITPVITASADPDCEGQKIYTFTYTDCANNEAVYTYTYNIEVPDAPIVPDNEG
ncbi:hypothetical protein, partial [Algibacter amylolyticus]